MLPDEKMLVGWVECDDEGDPVDYQPVPPLKGVEAIPRLPVRLYLDRPDPIVRVRQARLILEGEIE